MNKQQLDFLKRLIEPTDQQRGIYFMPEDNDYMTVKDFCGATSSDKIKKGVYVYDTQIDDVCFLDFYIPNKTYIIKYDYNDCTDGKMYYFDLDNILEVEAKRSN